MPTSTPKIEGDPRLLYTLVKNIGKAAEIDTSAVLASIRRRIIRESGKEPIYDCKLRRMVLSDN